MRALEKGRVSAMYAGSEGTSWIGRTCCVFYDREFIPFTIDGRRFVLELKLPRHLTEPNCEPKEYKLGINQRFLPRRDYRELYLYELDESNILVLNTGENSSLDLKANGPLLLSTLRNAICQYASEHPTTTQFLFRADGVYAEFITQTMELSPDDPLLKHYRITRINELEGPYYGFDLTILALTA